MFASGLVYTLPDVSLFACPGAINDETPAKSMHCTGCAGVAQYIKMEVTQKQCKQTRILNDIVFIIHVHMKCSIQHVKFE